MSYSKSNKNVCFIWNLVIIVLSIYNKSKMGKQIEGEQQYQQRPQKSRYTKTSIKKKQQLIDLVLNKSYTMYKACKILKISNTTGKAIILNFQKYGVILNRNNPFQYQRTINRYQVKSQSGSLKVKQQALVKEEDISQIHDTERWKIQQKMEFFSYQYSIQNNGKNYMVKSQQ